MTSKSPKTSQKPLKTQESIAAHNFKLPDSLSLSEVNLPILKKPPLRRGGWKELCTEHEQWVTELDVYKDKREQKEEKPNLFYNTETSYIQKEVLAALLPALEQTLNQAKMWNALEQPKCFFNGVDHIAQILWMNNARHPSRQYDRMHIFNMPWVKKHLETQPRPFYPKSWLWTEDYAATVIQRSFRRYLVQLHPDVWEMREFWQKLRTEGRLSREMAVNPILCKKFASGHSRIVAFNPNQPHS